MSVLGLPRLLVVVFCCLLWIAACSDDKSTESDSVLIIDTLPILADARVQSDAPSSTLGLDDELCVVRLVYTGGPTVVYRTVLRLPPLPDSVNLAALQRADLILHYKGSETSRSSPVMAFEAAGEWTEDSVTWFSQPAVEIASFASDTVASKKLRIDVSTLYLLADSAGYSVTLMTDDGMEQRFHSREASPPGAPPLIEFAYRSPF